MYISGVAVLCRPINPNDRVHIICYTAFNIGGFFCLSFSYYMNCKLNDLMQISHHVGLTAPYLCLQQSHQRFIQLGGNVKFLNIQSCSCRVARLNNKMQRLQDGISRASALPPSTHPHFFLIF